MAELNSVVLNAGSADASSGIFDTGRMDNVFFQVTATVTAATLSATLAITNGLNVSPGGGLPPAASLAPASVISGTLPGTIALGAGTGVFTITNLAIGTYDFIVKLSDPGPVSQVVYDYTSGGGTVSIIVRAYGWKHAT